MNVHPSWQLGAAGDTADASAKPKSKTHEALNLLLFAYVGLRLLGVDPLKWFGED